MFGSGIYLLAMGVGGYYVRDYGGTWGTVAQTIFLFGAGLVLLILLFSVPLRARLRVLINKHFFHYKYDYREEWLRFIRTLSASNEDTSLPERAIRAIAQMMDSPGGLLWMRTEYGHFEPAARWNMDIPPSAKEAADSSLIRFLEIQKWVINLDEYQRDPGMYRSLGDLDIPRWLTAIPNSWLISPLILHDNLLGFVVLARSPALYGDFNWEDCDLLKTTGTEAASHLAQHAASQALVEARQFEAINRLSTYIVHDLKNLITQLSLVVSNAAKHRNNPLFMENAISTVDNSVAKMNRLLKHFRDGVQDDRKQVDLAKLLEEAVRDAQAAKPAPCFECHASDVTVAADRDRLASVVGHVIRNAQDATPEDGRVVNTFVVQALRGEPITLHGDGSQTRSFCHVADEILGLVAVMDGHITGPVNVGNAGEFTMRKLAEMIIDITGSASEIITVALPAEREGDPLQRQPDSTLIESTYGWKPTISLRDGLTRMIEFFRAHETL